MWPMRRDGQAKDPEEAGSLPQHQEVLRHGKTPNACGFVDLRSLVPHSSCACFNW